jgi:hypothetical protein
LSATSRGSSSTPSGQRWEASERCALTRGGDRVAGPREGNEERITLGVDLATVVLVERCPQQALMLTKDLGVAVAQPRQQPRRTLDVADRNVTVPRGSSARTRSYAQSPPPVKSAQSFPPTQGASRRGRI